jgi:hypothetical protein
MLEGALRLLCGSDIEDVLQPWFGCDGSRQRPRATHLGRGVWGGELPSPLHAMRNSSVESSIMAHHGVDVLLHVEPMKVAPASPLLGERLRPPK